MVVSATFPANSTHPAEIWGNGGPHTRGAPLSEQLAVQIEIVQKEHGHGSVNHLPSHSHAPRKSDAANHPEAFDLGRPFVSTYSSTKAWVRAR
jgi:hypothetical protein